MDLRNKNVCKKLFVLFFLSFKDIYVAAKTKKVAAEDDDSDKAGSNNNLFKYDCFLPDGRPYKSTIPCPKYTPDGRVVLRAPAGKPNPCANAGNFVNAYCIADYNCNQNNNFNNNFNNNNNNFNNNNNNQLANNNQQQLNNTTNQQVECIRAHCCTRTITQKNKVNVRNKQDTSLCTNGGYSMNTTCSQDTDCNPNDVGRAARGYSLLKCINNNCCSRPYKKPSQNQICLNGGRSVGYDCVVNDDCRGANNNNNGNNNNQGGAYNVECVEHTCCSQPNQRFNNAGNSEEDDDDSQDSEEDNSLCRNGGIVLRNDGGHIIYCSRHEECGNKAICSSGRCCSNTNNRGRRRGSDFRRGTAMCSSLAPAPSIYMGQHCSRASDCGRSTYNTYSCAGGYCCEEDNDLVNLGAGGSQRDGVCNYQGFFLGTSCADDRDCTLSQHSARANVCINRSCCSIPKRLADDDNVNSLNGPESQFCRGGEYRQYMEEICSTTSDCPVYAGAGGVRIPVRCRAGVCCALGFGKGTYQLNDLGGNAVVEPGQQGPIAPRRPAGSVAICYDGSLSAAECQQNSECQTGHSCVNHLCCPKREDERQYVCGGLAANGDCFANGQCRSDLFCTAAKLCCECRYGQPQLGVGLEARLDCRQNTALCKQGYICNSGGFCCPKCSNNEVPFGSCSAGRCGNGYACQPGNICCQADLTYTQGLVPSRNGLAYHPYFNQVGG